MIDRFRRAMNYWMFAVSHPLYVLDFAQKDMHRVRISFYIVLVFSFLMAFSSMMLWRAGRLPMMETWVPYLALDEYYYFQAFWMIPWMLLVWLASAGFIYLFTSLAGKQGVYEDCLMISSLSLAVPYLMFWWIPDTFLLTIMGPGTGTNWPELFELERRFMFPQLWQLAIVGFGMRKLNTTNRLACIAAGVFVVLAMLALYLPFIR